jgi:hypothetical protein
MTSLPDKPPLPTGHDAPVAERADDFYDRWPIATAISRVIAASPAPWSTRVGLFGRWGDGKTSVLNFLEQQQREAGHIVIRYNPWGAVSEEEVWRGFGSRLIEGLDAHGIKVGLAARLQHHAKAWRVELARWLRWGAQAAGMAQVPGATLGGEVAASLVEKHLGLTRKDVQRIGGDLGERRVVVFIDDLDRADPVLVPRLLLALRELLDFARFAFVLTFDRRIVANALEQHHRAWGRSGENFLDKVIDFPFELPEPTQEQVRALAMDQFAKLCPFVPVEALVRMVPLLPPSPRRLKLLVRMLSSTRDEALRHEAGELDWEVVLLFTLIRVESEALARRLLTLAEDAGAVDPPRSDDVAGLLAAQPEVSEEPERMAALLRAWLERLAAVPAERLRYQALFALTPHGITAGEFKAFFQQWCPTQDRAIVRRFIQARRLATQQTQAAIEDEFVQSALGHYAAVLTRASEAEAGDAHLALMNEAFDVLDLLSQALVGPQGVCTPGPAALMRHWDQLFRIALQWRHCDANLQEPELRHQEIDTLVALAQRVDDPLGVYGRLRRDPADPTVLSSEREQRQRKRFIILLRRRLESAAINAAWGCLARPGEMKHLRTKAEHAAARYLFTAPDSPLFVPARQAQLVQALKDRWGTPEAVEDAVDYMDLLQGALAGEDDPYATAAQRARFLRTHPEVAITLWDLCISAPSQFRVLAALRRRRERLVEAGIEAQRLQEPEWLRRMDRAA